VNPVKAGGPDVKSPGKGPGGKRKVLAFVLSLAVSAAMVLAVVLLVPDEDATGPGLRFRPSGMAERAPSPETVPEAETAGPVELVKSSSRQEPP
jgi:hypothetical protein